MAASEPSVELWTDERYSETPMEELPPMPAAVMEAYKFSSMADFADRRLGRQMSTALYVESMASGHPCGISLFRYLAKYHLPFVEDEDISHDRSKSRYSEDTTFSLRVRQREVAEGEVIRERVNEIDTYRMVDVCVTMDYADALGIIMDNDRLPLSGANEKPCREGLRRAMRAGSVRCLDLMIERGTPVFGDTEEINAKSVQTLVFSLLRAVEVAHRDTLEDRNRLRIAHRFYDWLCREMYESRQLISESKSMSSAIESVADDSGDGDQRREEEKKKEEDGSSSSMTMSITHINQLTILKHCATKERDLIAAVMRKLDLIQPVRWLRVLNFLREKMFVFVDDPALFADSESDTQRFATFYGKQCIEKVLKSLWKWKIPQSSLAKPQPLEYANKYLLDEDKDKYKDEIQSYIVSLKNVFEYLVSFGACSVWKRTVSKCLNNFETELNTLLSKERSKLTLTLTGTSLGKSSDDYYDGCDPSTVDVISVEEEPTTTTKKMKSKSSKKSKKQKKSKHSSSGVILREESSLLIDLYENEMQSRINMIRLAYEQGLYNYSLFSDHGWLITFLSTKYTFPSDLTLVLLNMLFGHL